MNPDDSERAILEEVFQDKGSLRTPIPTLIQNRIYFDRLLNCCQDWALFKDSLLGLKITVGNLIEINLTTR